MPEPIPWDELPGDVLHTARQALEAAVATITTELRGRTDTVEDLDSGPATAWRDHHLARIASATTLTTWLRQEISSEAYLAGHREDAPATYTDLGKAAGLTKEGARGRFAGAIPDAKPGRPKKQVTVTLSGGHPQWDGRTLEYDRSSVYDLDLDDVGALLMIPDGSFPERLAAQGEGVDWRAHYAPVSEDTRTTWVFQGWVPS